MGYVLAFLLLGTTGLLFAYLLRGNKAKPIHTPDSSFSEDGLPIAEETSTVPVIFGTVELNQSNLVGYGGYRVEEVVISRTKVGRKYGVAGKSIYQEEKGNKCRICMHLVLGLGSFDNVQRVYFDDKVTFGGVWTKYKTWEELNGTNTGGESDALAIVLKRAPFIGSVVRQNGTGEPHNLYYDNDYLMDNRSVDILNESLFGGMKSEGGVQGRMDIMFGLPTQGVNEDLKLNIAKGNPCPAFRNVTSLYFHDFFFGTQPYMKQIKILASRIQRSFYGESQWYATKAKMGADMNPAHIIREVLVSPLPEWGMNLSPTLIDDDSFRAAANVLFEEDFGLSFIWDKESSTSDFLDMVCDHINAIIITERNTQRRKLKLIRDDYDFNNLRALTYDEVKSLMSYNMTEPVDLYNQVVVNYWDRERRAKGSITRNNPAMYDVVKVINSKSKNYDGCKRYELAERLAMRDLKMLSTPLSKIKLQCNRLAFNLQLGDVIRVKLEYEVVEDVAYRVNKLTFDDEGNYVTVEAVQDIFGLPKYVPNNTPSVVLPTIEPKNAKNVVLGEMTYLDIVKYENNTDINIAKTYMYVFAEKDYIENNYTLAVKTDNDFINHGTGNFTNASNKLKEKLSRTATVIKATSLADLSTLDVLQVNNERMLILDTNATDGTITVARGYEDTQLQEHPVGSVLYNVDNAFIDIVPFDIGTTAEVKLITNTGSGANLPLASATSRNITFTGRQIAPYPPQNVKVNGEYYPDKITLKTAQSEPTVTYFELQASSRNKQEQARLVNIDWFSQPVGNSAVKHYYSIAGLQGKTEFTANDTSVQIKYSKAQLNGKLLKVWSEQDGKECTYPFTLTLNIV